LEKSLYYDARSEKHQIIEPKGSLPHTQQSVQHVTVLNTVGNCNKMVLWYYII